MVSLSSGWIFLIGSKKLAALCSHNLISRNFYIAATPKVSARNISFVTFLFTTTPVNIHINGRGIKGRLMLFQVFPKYCPQHLDLSLFLTDSSQDACNFGHRNSNAYKKNLKYLLYRHYFSPPFNSLNICREDSTTSYE